MPWRRYTVSERGTMPWRTARRTLNVQRAVVRGKVSFLEVSGSPRVTHATSIWGATYGDGSGERLYRVTYVRPCTFYGLQAARSRGVPSVTRQASTTLSTVLNHNPRGG